MTAPFASLGGDEKNHQRSMEDHDIERSIDGGQHPGGGGLMATTSLARPVEPRFTSVDLLLISFWACLLFLCLTIPHLLFLLWSLLGGAVMIACHFWLVVHKRQPREGNLVIALIMPLAMLTFSFVFPWVNRATPVTYDSLLASWDFGMAPAVRAWTITKPLLWDPALVAYEALPSAVLIIIVMTRGYARARLVWSAFVGPLLVVPCYLMFPAVGPIHVGDPNAPRNCVPSMHLTCALFLWINTRGWLRWVTATFVLFTALATLATGEHYVFDLAVALPWTWFITALAGWFVSRFTKLRPEEDMGEAIWPARKIRRRKAEPSQQISAGLADLD
ncbi:MAG TPA: phosphatase PAP2 family protein [Terracidiphilus sp.]|jgi:hypothetical protein